MFTYPHAPSFISVTIPYSGRSCLYLFAKHMPYVFYSASILSKYNRANDVTVCVCVWQTTPRTAEITVTKIAGYVRVRILMNRRFFFVFLALILFHLRPICWIYEYECCQLLDKNSVGQPIIPNRGRQVVHAMNWLHQWRHNCWWCHCGQVRHNNSSWTNAASK